MTSIDFAAAQQRILARRAARDAAPTPATPAASSSALSTATLRALPAPLRSLLASSLPFLTAFQSPYGTRPAFRVGQLDAELLDEELLGLLRAQVGDALRLLPGAHLEDDWSAEISAGLRGALWWLSVWARGVSYGGSLQGLKFVDSREEGGLLERLLGFPRGTKEKGVRAVESRKDPSTVQRVLYGLVTVGGRYGWDKWEDWLLDREGGYDASPLVERLSRVTRALSASHEVAALAGFLVFLFNGRYRTLVDRVLGLRLVPATAQTAREVSFEYLNRQLVWHAFTEFLLFILPLVGINRWRRWLARAWRKVKSLVTRRAEDEDEAMAQGELGFLPERTCAICYKDQNPTAGASEANVIAASSGGGGGIIGSAQTDITNPYEAIPCGCVYCFGCLAHRIEAEDGEGWTCLRCGELVKECKPWSGDVIEETASPSTSGSKGTGKSVVFVDTTDEEENGENLQEILSPVEPMPLFDDDNDDEATTVEEPLSDQEEAADGADLTGESTEWISYDDGAAEADVEASELSDATE